MVGTATDPSPPLCYPFGSVTWHVIGRLTVEVYRLAWSILTHQTVLECAAASATIWEQRTRLADTRTSFRDSKHTGAELQLLLKPALSHIISIFPPAWLHPAAQRPQVALLKRCYVRRTLYLFCSVTSAQKQSISSLKPSYLTNIQLPRDSG